MPPYRYQQAPWDFNCCYRHCCPHLQGLSTKWVFEEYQRSHDEHLEHWKVRDIQQEELEKALEYIGKLEYENEELKARLKALHQRQFKSNKKRKQKSSETSTDDRSASKKRKNVVHPKDIRAGIGAKPIMSIKPLWFRLLRYALIALVVI